MDVSLPCAEDHCRILIFVKPLGQLDSLIFNRVLQRLTKAEVIEVSDNPQRIIRARFITCVNGDCFKFSEFQTYRKVFGLLCIAQSDLIKSERRRSSSPDAVTRKDDKDANSLESIREQYKSTEFRDNLLDSRCVLFGYEHEQEAIASLFELHEILAFPRLDDSNELELGVRELVRSIYFILESRRLNTSFEKMETPPCPLLPEEEKYRIGTDNTKSKTYKRKCIGRNRKQVADYALLTGLPTLALDAYQSAIECLEQASDFLWLAAAFEGWCCAAIMIKYKHKIESSGRQPSGLHRVSTADFSPLKLAGTGHHRYRSDDLRLVQKNDCQKASGQHKLAEKVGDNDDLNRKDALDGDRSRVSMSIAGGEDGTAVGTDGGRKSDDTYEKTWRNTNTPSPLAARGDYKPLPTNASDSPSPQCGDTKSLLTVPPPSAPSLLPSSAAVMAAADRAASKSLHPLTAFSAGEIFTRFRAALDNYGKYSFATHVECECVVRNVHVFIYQRMHIEAEAFIHERMAKFLDDNFNAFDNKMKAHICLICAAVCQKIGFMRKHAFYLRLSVLFRLNVASENAHSEEKDYQAIYPILYRSLRGYGIRDDVYADGKSADELSVGGAPPSSSTAKLSAVGDQKRRKRNVPFAIQVKAVYEVFISASRAGYHDVAIRHLCYILQHYFYHMSTDELLSMIEELSKLVAMRKDVVHSLAQPISLDHCSVILPPVQFSRFPILSNFRVCPLPYHLAPNVIDPAEVASKVFIYSPFQNRKKDHPDVYWVVDCACEVSICVRNPLPVELMVKNLSLLTAGGCQFDAIPVRLNLPSCYGSTIDPSASTIKLLGVPRSAGTLTLTGYSCEVLGVRNVCSLAASNEAAGVDEPSAVIHAAANFATVKVLQSLPLLSFETSLKMTPVAVDSDDSANAGTSATAAETNQSGCTSVAEATVFSGQTFDHSIFLHNTSATIAIKKVVIKINQPQVCGGPKLLEVLGSMEVFDVAPLERREVKIRIFGIDPSANTQSANSTGGGHGGLTALSLSSGQTNGATARGAFAIVGGAAVGKEHRVYVRRHTSLSSTANQASLDVTGSDFVPSILLSSESHPTTAASVNTSAATKKRWSSPISLRTDGGTGGAKTTTMRQLSPTSAAEKRKCSADGDGGGVEGGQRECLLASDETSMRGASVSPQPGHDLIPYIGRLLSAEFIFTYTADVCGAGGERYEREAKLPLAIAIVPAVNVSDWHILAGDGPTTRYVVVDVANLTDTDAELTYGDGRMISVQPKEVCRVPLLCPCCMEIPSSAFATAAALASHMMQMQEIERLRRTLERHVARYLDIRWTIPALKLDGFVPVGSLLSSVSFLKQLVIPAISVSISINGQPYVSEDDIVVGIGELVQIRVLILVSIKRDKLLRGEIALSCYQDLQQSAAPKINRDEHLIACGASRVPFALHCGHSVAPSNGTSPDGGGLDRFEITFSVLFRYEGIHKVRPELSALHVTACGCGGDASAAIDRVGNRVPLNDDDIFLPSASFNVTTARPGGGGSVATSG